jgi:glycine cleavage system aminomethyltransferase T
VGYGRLIDWNHDFLGRGALRELAVNQRRTKVTLVWNDDDIAATVRSSLFDSGHPGRYLALPTPMYATFESDAVLRAGEPAGVSQWSSYSANAGHVISLALVGAEHAEPGTELTLLWGEPDTRRPAVDRHELRDIRVTVAPVPYFEKVIKTRQQ